MRPNQSMFGRVFQQNLAKSVIHNYREAAIHRESKISYCLLCTLSNGGCAISRLSYRMKFILFWFF